MIVQLGKRFLFWVILVGGLGIQSAGAHEGHDHVPVSLKSALEISLKTVKKYVRTESPFAIGKLPSSWAACTEADASIHENGRGYYVVAVNNPQKSKTLYLKILLDGSIAGANYTGEFVLSSSGASSSAKYGR